MSNYTTRAINPLNGKVEQCEMLDDYFGKHQYGVRFSYESTTYRPDGIMFIDGHGPYQRLVDAAKVALDHVTELREAFSRGVIYETDCRGGTRSNNNVQVQKQLAEALKEIEESQ